MGVTAEFEFIPYNKVSGEKRKYDAESITNFDEYHQFINNGTALGELCHDRSPTAEISLTNVSHKINSMHVDESGVSGVVEILSTPRGELAKILLEAGMITIRPRLIGIIDNGVVRDAVIVSFDFISSMNDTFNPDTYKNRRYRLKIKGHETMQAFHHNTVKKF